MGKVRFLTSVGTGSAPVWVHGLSRNVPICHRIEGRQRVGRPRIYCTFIQYRAASEQKRTRMPICKIAGALDLRGMLAH